MLLNKKISVLFLLVAMVLLGIAASQPPAKLPKRNLKVLPKNISYDALDSIMDGFKDALGIKCNYCHASQKEDPQKLNFASDEKPEKEMARKMLRMTIKINRKFFHYKEGRDKEAYPPVTCKTCHNGKPRPGQE